MPRKQAYSVKFKLEAVELAEKTSGNAAARQMNVDRRRITEWKQQKDKLVELQAEKNSKGKVRKRIPGAGRELVSNEMEEFILNWITDMRSRGCRVSRKMIQLKAKEVFQEVEDSTAATFTASNGWLDYFLKRHGLSNRRATTVSQKDPADLTNKLAAFVLWNGSMRKKHSIQESNIIAMDETAVFFDMLSNSTIEAKGSKTVTLGSSGHEQNHATVVLAAKADGTKLKPYVVFKEAKREVQTLATTISTAKVVSTSNGWMNETATCDWLDSVYGRMAFGKRLLVWDSYRCHISKARKEHLKQFNTVTSVVPGGCTKYVQAPDLSWNKPFKDKVKEQYDAWFVGDENKEFTKGGNLRAAPKKLIVGWIISAWESISPEIIRNSIKETGITVSLDGSEDTQIHCMKAGNPCHSALAILTNFRSESSLEIIQAPEEAADEEELANNEIVIIDDE